MTISILTNYKFNPLLVISFIQLKQMQEKTKVKPQLEGESECWNNLKTWQRHLITFFMGCLIGGIVVFTIYNLIMAKL